MPQHSSAHFDHVADKDISMQTEHPTTPLELPEILYVLVQFLDRPTLLQASRVSRSWSKIFSPMLFREVRYEDWKHPQFIDLLCKNLDQVVCLEWRFSRREAKLRYREIMKQHQRQHHLHPQSQNLQVGGDPRFEILSRSPSPEPQSSSSSAGSPTLGQSHSYSSSSSTAATEPQNLNRICLGDFAAMLSPKATPRLRLLAVQGEMELRRFLITILPKVPTMTCLRIEDSFSWQKIGIGEILNACQSLESLDCDGSVALQFDDAFLKANPVPDGVCTIGDSGQELEQGGQIQGSWEGSKATTLSSTASLVGLPLSHRTQNLQILRLHKTSLSDQDLLQLIRQCPELQELFLHQEGNGGTLGGGQPLANADATHQWNWSEAFVTEMAKACPKLVKIHLSPGCFQSLPESIILRVLAAFPRLRSLGVPFSQFGDETMQEILRTRVHVQQERLERPQQQLQRRQEQQQLPAVNGSESLTSKTTLKSAPSSPNFSPLTSLDLTDLKGHRLSSLALQTFLENCSELLRFKGDKNLLKIQDMVHLDRTHPDSSTSLTAFQLRPWACLRLETLVIGFSRCQSPVKTYGGAEPGACRSIRENEDEVVFRQLSRLTKLRRLEILKDAPNWSALTLSKGSSAASSLSALEVLQAFKISDGAIPPSLAMASSMSDPADRRAEQERQQRNLASWIVKAWPRLQTLHVPGSRHQQRNRDWSRLFQELGRSNIQVVPSEES